MQILLSIGCCRACCIFRDCLVLLQSNSASRSAPKRELLVFGFLALSPTSQSELPNSDLRQPAILSVVCAHCLASPSLSLPKSASTVGFSSKSDKMSTRRPQYVYIPCPLAVRGAIDAPTQNKFPRSKFRKGNGKLTRPPFLADSTSRSSLTRPLYPMTSLRSRRLVPARPLSCRHLSSSAHDAANTTTTTCSARPRTPAAASLTA